MTNLAFRSLDPMTQAEFVRWLETVPQNDLHHYELLDGFIVMEPPAGWPHGGIEIEIGSRLRAFLEAHPIGRLCGSSQGFELPTGDTVEPDLAFISQERWATLPRPIRGFLRVVPDLVVEILSPGTRRIDRGQKKKVYERNGVREYWLVDPKSHSVEVFRLRESGKPTGPEQDQRRHEYGPGRRFAAADTLDCAVLPGLRLAVADLFLVD
jgi:Uma2 family endonuclease